MNVNLASDEGIFYTAVHEYMHYLEGTAPHLLKDYLKQVDKLIEMSPKFKKIADDWKQRYKSDERTKDISEEDLRNEIAFKITKHLIDNPSEFRNIVTKDLTIGQRLLIWFKNLANRLSKHKLTEEAKAVRDAVRALEMAVKETGKDKKTKATDKVATTKGGVKYSLDEFSKGVDETLKGVNPDRDVEKQMLYLGETPNYIQRIGFEPLPLLIAKRHIREMNTPKSITNPHLHGLTVETIKKLPDLIKDPVAALVSSTRPRDSMVLILDELDSDGLPIIASLTNDGTGNYNYIKRDANILTSAYGKDGFLRFFKNAISNNKVIFARKNKSQNLFGKVGLQLPQFPKDFSFNTIIFKYNKNSKTFYKISSKSTEKSSQTNEKAKYSLPKDIPTYKSDVITNIYEETDGKRILTQKEYKGATVREYNGYYYIKPADGTSFKRKIGAKGTFIMKGTAETAKEKVLTTIPQEYKQTRKEKTAF